MEFVHNRGITTRQEQHRSRSSRQTHAAIAEFALGRHEVQEMAGFVPLHGSAFDGFGSAADLESESERQSAASSMDSMEFLGREASTSIVSHSAGNTADGVVAGNRQKQRQRKSPVFQFITEAARTSRSDGSRQPFWMCLLCQPSETSPVCETDNTSNFWKHLETHHRAHYQQIRRLPEIAPDEVHTRAGGFTKTDQDRGTASLVRLIVKHAHPFAIVEQEGFIDYSNTLQPAYKVPCRQTIAKKVKESWESQKEAVRQILRWDLRDGKRSSVTTDLWTSSGNRGYMVVTLHYIDDNWRMRSLIVAFVRVVYPHSGERLASNLIDAMREMDPQVVTSMWSITADNASNNGTMVESICVDLPVARARDQDSQVRRVVYVRCLAHVLQLAVKKGIASFSGMNEALGGLREVVKKMGDSPKLFEAYTKVCMSMNPVQTAKLFPIDVPTRWNSTYEMIDVVLASRKTVEELLHHIRQGYTDFSDLSLDAQVALSITPQVWENASKFHEFLGPIADATALISGSEYPTLGAVVAIYKIVCFHVDRSVREAEEKLRELGQDPVDTSVRMSLAESFDGARSVGTDPQRAAKITAWKRAVAFFRGVQSKLVEYRSHVVSREAKIAGGLDPRFKSFAEDDTQQLIIDAFNAEYRERFNSTRRGRDPGIMSPPTKYPKLLQIVHDMSGASRRRRVRHSIEEEIEDWFTNPSLVMDLNSHDVCDWFCANQEGFPRIAFMAREYLAIPATSVPSEVAFSKAGSTVDDRRSRLLDESVRSIMELQSYLAFLDPDTQKRRVLVYAQVEAFSIADADMSM